MIVTENTEVDEILSQYSNMSLGRSSGEPMKPQQFPDIKRK
jgi:hypothetical protein